MTRFLRLARVQTPIIRVLLTAVVGLVLGAPCIAASTSEKTAVPKDDWGTAQDGLQSRIILEKKRFVQGEAVVAKVEVRNVSDKPALYDMRPLQADEESGMPRFAIGSDERVPEIGATAQIKAPDKPYAFPALKPGETATVDEKRLDAVFYLGRPGRYNLVWPGAAPWPADSALTQRPARSPATPLPPTAAVEFEVVATPGGMKDGDPVGRLLAVLPPGWKIEGAEVNVANVGPPGRVAGRGTAIGLVHRPCPGLLVSNAAMHVWLMPVAPAPAPQAADVIGHDLGKGPLGHVYLAEGFGDPLGRWNFAAHDIAVALDVTEPKPETPKGVDWGRVLARILADCTRPAAQVGGPHDTLQIICGADLERHGALASMEFSRNARHLEKTKIGLQRIDPKQPYYEVSLRVVPLEPDKEKFQVACSRVTDHFTWGPKNTFGFFELTPLGVDLWLRINSDDEAFRKAFDAIVEDEINRVLRGAKAVGAPAKPATLADELVKGMGSWYVLPAGKAPEGEPIIIAQDHKTYAGMLAQQLPQQGKARLDPSQMRITGHSYVQLRLFPAQDKWPEGTAAKLGWRQDLKDEYAVRAAWLGQGRGYSWFADGPIPFLHRVRQLMKLEGGEDWLAVLADGLLVKDKGGMTRNSCIAALTRYGDDALPYLRRVLPEARKDEPYAVTGCLGYIHTDASTRMLVELFADADQRVRGCAAQALVHQPYREDAKDTYLAMLRQGYYVPQACVAAREFGGKEAVPLLEAIMARPKTWWDYRYAFETRRALIGKPVPEAFARAEDTLHAKETADNAQEQAAARNVLIGNADHEAAAVVGVGLVLYVTKGDVSSAHASGLAILHALPQGVVTKLARHLLHNLQDADRVRELGERLPPALR